MHADSRELAFVSEADEPADVEIRVNFGVFAGRDVTLAEIDRLGRALLDELPRVSIVAVHRHELEREHEAVVHQVKVEARGDGGDVEGLRERLQWLTEAWARECISERHAEVSEL